MKSIRTKLVLLLALSAAIALFLSSIAISAYTFYEKKKENIRTLGELTVVIAENLVAPVEFADEGTSRVILQTLESNSDIEGAFIFTGNNSLFSSYVKDKNHAVLLRETTSLMYKINDIKKAFEYVSGDMVVINYPILSDGEYLGSINIISNTDSLNRAISHGLILQFFVSIISLIIIVLLAFRLQKIFTVPILSLKKAMEEVTLNNNYDIRTSSENKDEFKSLNDGFNSMIKTISERTNEIQNLLDHADQGFLSFSKDLKVHSQYSKECVNIFSRKISGLKISDLLYENDNPKKVFFEDTLIDLFTEEGDTAKLIISLLDKDFNINNKRINIQYKLLEENHFMLILTDITEKIKLERELGLEKDILKMVVSSVSGEMELHELLKNYEDFIKNVKQSISPILLVRDNVAKLYREVHTYKGLFLQRDFINTPKGLHILETKLTELKDSISQDNSELLALLSRVKFEKWLENDKEILKQALGYDFFEENTNISISKDNFDNLESSIQNLLQMKDNSIICNDIIASFKRCKYKSLFKLLEPYKKVVERLSKKLNKKVYALELYVDETISVSNEYKPLIDTLIHVFRNSVDHGIEGFEERFSLNKNEFARISCTVVKTEDSIIMEISDDGRGIDFSLIKEKAKKQKLLSEDELNSMNQDEIIGIIFNDYFSTVNTVTGISGRGIGLSALKHEVLQLDGTIQINTKIGIGTTFIIKLPKSKYAI